ncbi:hypothetical protein M0802_008973 [Mischocyttarus mexicanus]|nr:hypothetical protein M0802_008973 [Mischocyttarus mexicanus]
MKIYLAYFLLWGFISNQQQLVQTAESSATVLADGTASVSDNATVLETTSSNNSRWSSGDDEKLISSNSSNSVEGESEGETLAKAILNKSVGSKSEVGSTGEINPVLQDDNVPENNDGAFSEAVKGTVEEAESKVQVREIDEKADVEAKSTVKVEAEAKTEEEDNTIRVRAKEAPAEAAEVEDRIQAEVAKRVLALAKEEAKIQADKAVKANANAIAKTEAYLQASLAAEKASLDAAEKIKEAMTLQKTAAVKAVAAKTAFSNGEAASLRAVALAAAAQASQIQALTSARAGAIAQRNSFFQALTTSKLATANAAAANDVQDKVVIVKQKVNETINGTEAAIIAQAAAKDEITIAVLNQNDALTTAISTSVLQIAALAEANAAFQDILAVNVPHIRIFIPQRNYSKSFVPLDDED